MSSTTYAKGTRSTSANGISTGESVLALGTTSGTTIKATQVIVTADRRRRIYGRFGGKGDPLPRGAPTTTKQVGEIPANWSQGSGTIVSGTAANKATEAALAAYPGGIVDRVVTAEQRRVQRPLHRRQLAAPRLRQPGLQGRRRPLAFLECVICSGGTKLPANSPHSPSWANPSASITSALRPTMGPRSADSHTVMAYAPVNGLQLYYETRGTGRPLVLLHGGLMTIELNFGPLLEPLAASRQVIAVELRATGTPPTPTAP